MTLIATMRIHGSPVLLGDLLITGGIREETRRKVSVLRRNLALAWTGSLLDAQRFFRELNASLPMLVTEGNLQVALQAAAEATKPTCLTIVGWLLVRDPVAFNWDSRSYKRVEFGPLVAEGTGAAALRNINPRLQRTSTRVRQRPATFSVVAADAVDVVGLLMSSELLGEHELRRKFFIGGGYDLVIGDGCRFRYVSPAVYACMSASVDQEGNLLKMHPVHGFALFRNFREHILIQSFVRGREDGISMNLTLPIVEKTIGENEYIESRFLRTRKAFPFRGRMLVLLIFVHDGRSHWDPIVAKIEWGNPVWKGATERGFTIDDGFLRATFKDLASRDHGVIPRQ